MAIVRIGVLVVPSTSGDYGVPVRMTDRNLWVEDRDESSQPLT